VDLRREFCLLAPICVSVSTQSLRAATILARSTDISFSSSRGGLDGEHPALLPLATFEAAQRLLADQAPRRRQPRNADQLHLLSGLLLDETGHRLRSVHTSKKGVRYRYYVSRPVDQLGTHEIATGWRLPAEDVERVVERALDGALSDRARLSEWLAPWTSELPVAFNNADAIIAVGREADDGADKSMTDLAQICGTDTSEVSRLLPLAFVSPAITDAILPASSRWTSPPAGSPGSMICHSAGRSSLGCWVLEAHPRHMPNATCSFRTTSIAGDAGTIAVPNTWARKPRRRDGQGKMPGNSAYCGVSRQVLAKPAA
jgi:hypothetical protein